MNSPSNTRSRLKLLTVIGFFVVPLVLAVAGFYLFPQLFLSEKTVNHGTLVHPARPLQPFTNLKLDGEEINLDALQNRWSIVHRLGQDCADPCAKALYNTRQVRLALGKDTNRVQRLLLGRDVRLIETASETHPRLIQVLNVVEGLDAQLRPIVEDYDLGQDDALLIDPHGNVMMSIAADLNPSLLLKDLKKLLRLSKIG